MLEPFSDDIKGLEEFYTLPYVCSNCDHQWSARLGKGQLAGVRECPNCGCRAGRKNRGLQNAVWPQSAPVSLRNCPTIGCSKEGPHMHYDGTRTA